MTVYTIGFAQKTAREFFSLLKNTQIQVLVDVRLNNKSQLAGFTKANDLSFFLKEICGCEYLYYPSAAPTKEILDAYKKKQITWEEYETAYLPLMNKRHAAAQLLKKVQKYDRICLLCSEPSPEKCHRRLFAELLHQENESITIKHLETLKHE